MKPKHVQLTLGTYITLLYDNRRKELIPKYPVFLWFLPSVVIKVYLGSPAYAALRKMGTIILLLSVSPELFRLRIGLMVIITEDDRTYVDRT